MSQCKWRLKQADKDLAAQLSQTYELNPFLALILVSRGCRSGEDIMRYLAEDGVLIDPYLISGMKEAVERIRRALNQGEKIAVYGDFDADGVTATALMSTFLESQGGNVITYIPQREDEGYGLNACAVETLASQGTRLIVTVDNGIAAIDEAKQAAALGMDLVITDHHQPGEELPEAVAVIDPHCDKELPFHDWAGVGVAFKLVCALYEGDAEDLLETYSDLVAIGTVGDVVPLRGENRLLVKRGIAALNTGERIGLQAFREVTNSRQKAFTSSELAFVLAPRINAAGRMESASTALEMLVTDDYDTALLRASQLCEFNTQRQQIEQSILEEIKTKLEAHPTRLYDRVLVVDGEGYHNGVIGIVAARLTEAYGKPCVVLNRQEDGVARGSCRSVEGFSIYDALSACREHLERFGGHPMAAGLSLPSDKIEAFRKAINEYAKENFALMPVKELALDCRVSPAYLTLELLDVLELLEPFGAENDQPLFGLFQIQLTAVTPVGGGKHLRLGFTKGGRNYQMMYFGVTPEAFPFTEGDIIDAAVKISRNVFNGRESVSIHVCDLKPHCLNQERYADEKALYESFCAGEALEEKALMTLIPTREESGLVYRCLLKNEHRHMTVRTVYFALCGGNMPYGKIAASLAAFHETGLIEMEHGLIKLNKSNHKVDLETSKTFIELKSRVKYG